MRIISGKYKGFRFPTHRLDSTRPTTDRAKEALMNILHSRMDLEGISVLDLYAGTGNLSFEFLSRGAERVELIDQSRKAASYQHMVAEKLGVEIKLSTSKVIPFLKKCTNSYDLIFADPPYLSSDYKEIVELVKQGELLNPNGLLILEHDSKKAMDHPDCQEQRSYGQSTFSFFTFE